MNERLAVPGLTDRDAGHARRERTGDVRLIPCRPRLVQLLRAHLIDHATTADGRLFRGTRGGPIAESVYGRVGAKARQSALSPEEAASSMAARPYDSVMPASPRG
jgi:hypothetical protein